jgi:hypothetical protein
VLSSLVLLSVKDLLFQCLDLFLDGCHLLSS